nr:sensor histidine kinase [Paenibacillus soyae]
MVYRTLLAILFAVSIIVTMCFPVGLNGINYDLRSVPLAVGSLYGGGWVALALFGTLVLGRELLGFPDTGWYLLAMIPTYCCALLAIRCFRTTSVRWKIGIAFIMCSLIKLITLPLYYAFTDSPLNVFGDPLAMMFLYLFQGVLAGLFVYMIEFLNNYYQMQEEVVRSEKMRLVSEMAASVAHEIRNPLTAVRGFIHLLGAPGVNEEKRIFYRDICFTELERAELIISDYLSLARTDPETVETIDVNAEVNYLTNILLTYANLNNIKLLAELPDSAPLHTRGDRIKFRQALINIGKNAIEAMPDGGTLELRAERRFNKAVLHITDTGCGMTPAQVSRLGTPFYSTKEKGTGLGTMISFSIIKKMEGKIEVKSEEGKGTKFTLVLPEAKAE